MGVHEGNDGKLEDPCLKLDFGGSEYKSVELGDGTGFVALEKYETDMAKAKVDNDALRLYILKVTDLLQKALSISGSIWGNVPFEHIPISYAAGMNDLYLDIAKLGLEVE